MTFKHKYYITITLSHRTRFLQHLLHKSERGFSYKNRSDLRCSQNKKRLFTVPIRRWPWNAILNLYLWGDECQVQQCFHGKGVMMQWPPFFPRNHIESITHPVSIISSSGGNCLFFFGYPRCSIHNVLLLHLAHPFPVVWLLGTERSVTDAFFMQVRFCHTRTT